MSRNQKKIAKDYIKQKRIITIPNIIACVAFGKLASYNFCEHVTYRAVSLADLDMTHYLGPKELILSKFKSLKENVRALEVIFIKNFHVNSEDVRKANKFSTNKKS